MGVSLLLQNIAAAFSAGLGCGSCCGSSAGVFLTSYTMSHAANIKKSFIAFLSFFIGKMIAVIVVCVGASIVGSKFINEDGYLGKINLHRSLQVGLIIVGVVMIINWIKNFISDKKGECGDCGGKCHEHNHKEEKLKKWPPALIGFVYGITPCAPLFLMVGYSAAMSVFGAVIIAIVFTISTSITPLLLLVLFAGLLSKKMYDEIPKYVNYLKLSCYVLFIAMAFVII